MLALWHTSLLPLGRVMTPLRSAWASRSGVARICASSASAARASCPAIAATPGVDGVFIGPVDLSTSMGYPGQVDHPEVVAAIAHGIARTRQAGKAAGILSTQEDQAQHWLDAGALFVAVGVDINLLALAAQSLAARFRHGMAAPQPSSGGY